MNRVPPTRAAPGHARRRGSATAVDVHEVDARPGAAGECADHGPERRGRAAVAPDHLAEVVGVHAHLEDRPAAQLLVADRDVVGVVHDSTDQVLQRVGEHAAQDSALSDDSVSAVSAASAAPSGVSSAGTGAGASSAGASGASAAGVSAGASAAGASAAGDSSAFFSAFLRAVVAPALGSLAASLRASLKISSLSRLGSLTFRVPSVPGRPLNFCQSPVILRIFSTASVGCAPTPSQYSARSATTSMYDGSS